MNLWLRKCSSFEEEAEADREFWSQMTGDERVEALEDLRRQPGRFTGERIEDFEELFAFFNARKVKALIVGGFAVAFHAKPRFTKDIDLWIEPTPENATRLLAALADFGFGSLDLSVEDFIHPGRIVQLGHPRIESIS